MSGKAGRSGGDSPEERVDGVVVRGRRRRRRAEGVPAGYVGSVGVGVVVGVGSDVIADAGGDGGGVGGLEGDAEVVRHG